MIDIEPVLGNPSAWYVSITKGAFKIVYGHIGFVELHKYIATYIDQHNTHHENAFLCFQDAVDWMTQKIVEERLE